MESTESQPSLFHVDTGYHADCVECCPLVGEGEADPARWLVCGTYQLVDAPSNDNNNVSASATEPANVAGDVSQAALDSSAAKQRIGRVMVYEMLHDSNEPSKSNNRLYVLVVRYKLFTNKQTSRLHQTIDTSAVLDMKW